VLMIGWRALLSIGVFLAIRDGNGLRRFICLETEIARFVFIGICFIARPL